MRSMRRLSIFLAVVALVAFGIGSSPAVAVDLFMVNGDLETIAGPAGWTLTQSIVGMPGAVVSATELLDGANEPAPAEGELGLLIRPFAGNVGTFAGKNLALNLTLSQTVALPPVVGTYTFTGHSLVQASSSVIVDTMEALTPLGDYNLDTVTNAADYTIWRDTLGSTTDFRANGTNEGASLDLIDQADYDFWKSKFGDSGHLAGTPSPTETFFKVEFLNASDVVLATHSIDLRDDTTPGDPLDPQTDVWRTHTLAGIVSPAGTTKARVSAVLTNGVASCSMCLAGSDLLLDNFSLNRTAGGFLGEKLAQVGTPPISSGKLDTQGAPEGYEIMKTAQDNISFSLNCCEPANPEEDNHTPGGIIGMWLRSFSGGDAKLLRTVAATPGADYDFSAWSRWEQGYIDLDPAHPETETTMTLEYLDASSVLIGAPMVLLLDTVQMGDFVWRQFSVDGGTAPGNAAFVRVSVGAINMGVNSLGLEPQSAFFDDFSLIETLPGGAGGLAAVPEPSCWLLLGIALGVIGVGRRNSR